MNSLKRLSHEETESLNVSMMRGEIEPVIKCLPPKKMEGWWFHY